MFLRIAAVLPLAVAFLGCQRMEAQSSSALRQIAAIRLPGVSGRIDHLAFDPARQRLFVAALGNGTVEVVDTAKNAHLKSVPGFREPQGMALVSDSSAIAVANGDSGTLQLVDAETFATRWTVNIGGDADNLRYDVVAKRIEACGRWPPTSGGNRTWGSGVWKRVGLDSLLTP